MTKHYLSLLLMLTVLPPGNIRAQEAESFSLSDFQLQGPVEICVVKANYGEERFEFDRDGRLVKSLTRYSDSDYDITYYRFKQGLLSERRDEVYRGKVFDAQTSIAHIYQRDSSQGPRLIESIISYDKSFSEQVEYQYDDEGSLQRILRSNAEGVDETVLEYTDYQGEATTTYIRNGLPLKSIRISEKTSGGKAMRIELTKEYLDGEPRTAEEKTLNSDGQLIKEIRFNYDAAKKSFRPQETRTFTYNEEGFRVEEKTVYHGASDSRSDDRTEIRKYVYQMDGSQPGNWIRQIITPENSFVIRTISYYQPLPKTVVADSVQQR